MKISLVIPAYNEEKTIKDTLLEVGGYFSKQDYSYEIIVVNDGSVDKTSKIVSSLKTRIPNLKFLDNKINKGKGFAVKQGMLSATGDFLLFMDADNAIKINHLDKFLKYIKDFDLVIGSIELPGATKISKYKGMSNIYRRVLGKLSKYLIRVLTIWEIHDTQRAFKLFKKDVAKEIFSRQTINGWGFDIELLMIAKKLNYKIKELPVTWINPTGRANLSAYIKTLKELFLIKKNFLLNKYN